MNEAVKISARYDKRKWYKNIAKLAVEAAHQNNMRSLYQLTGLLANKGQVATVHTRDKQGNLLLKTYDQINRWKEQVEYYRDILSDYLLWIHRLEKMYL